MVLRMPLLLSVVFACVAVCNGVTTKKTPSFSATVSQSQTVNPFSASATSSMMSASHSVTSSVSMAPTSTHSFSFSESMSTSQSQSESSRFSSRTQVVSITLDQREGTTTVSGHLAATRSDLTPSTSVSRTGVQSYSSSSTKSFNASISRASPSSLSATKSLSSTRQHRQHPSITSVSLFSPSLSNTIRQAFHHHRSSYTTISASLTNFSNDELLSVTRSVMDGRAMSQSDEMASTNSDFSRNSQSVTKITKTTTFSPTIHQQQVRVLFSSPASRLGQWYKAALPVTQLPEFCWGCTPSLPLLS